MATPATTLDDLNGLMRGMMTAALERILDAEMGHHLGRAPTAVIATAGAAPDAPAAAPKSRRNGHSRKTVRGDMGPIDLATPRDRDGTFGPQLIAKRPRRLTGLDDKALAPSAEGLTARDIQEVVKQSYGVDVSPALVPEVTEGLDAEVTAWRTRRPDAVWPIASFDGTVIQVRGEDGRVVPHTMSVALGVNLGGNKGLSGLRLNQTEGAKFRPSCLTGLTARGVTDPFVTRVDGLTGFPEAIRTASPAARVRSCSVHLARAAWKYVADKDSREVAAGLKTICRAATVAEAGRASDRFAREWDAKYPTIARRWRPKWDDFTTVFDSPAPIRKAIYTTNTIESANGVTRKFARSRKQYPNMESALKSVGLAIREASKKWTMPIRGWKEALNHFAILFDGRMPTNWAA